jgi:hypothetical protein
MKQIIKQQVVSERAKEILERNEKIRKEDSIFLRIDPDEEITLKFDAELIEVKEVIFDGVKKRRFEYSVLNNTTHARKFWRVSQRTSAIIDSYLARGEMVLNVKRIGAGLHTKYVFSPS